MLRCIPAMMRFAWIGVWLSILSIAQTAMSDEAKWIWTSVDAANAASPGSAAFFRKPVNLKVSATSEIQITADDRFELFINGQSVGTGRGDRMATFDTTRLMRVGRNVIAVRVDNVDGATAGLAARVSVKPQNSQRWFDFHTGPSWRCTATNSPMWQTPEFNDRNWTAAAVLGTLGQYKNIEEQTTEITAETARVSTSDEQIARDIRDTATVDPATVNPAAMDPAAVDAAVAAVDDDSNEGSSGGRFQIQRGFAIERLLNDEQVGSVIAMAFNEFGHIILSQEGGPLLLVFDKDEDGIAERVRTYCDQVTSCQGILPLNGDVYVTGMGKDGQAVYRLRDQDRNGSLETVDTILKIKGSFGEHGAHGLRLGPDGMIYVALGSHVHAVGEGGPGETLDDVYEGDLLPRYNDPAGHAVGVKAPGGTIVRFSTDGSVVERITGGVRNAYDMAFHPDGSLFVHDADMESDVGTAWYRGTGLFEICEAGELGWRPGWSKWPEHYFDRLPMLADTGRGSPTGAICYDHFAYPLRYQKTLFLADWSEGRILNVRLKPDGSTYQATAEVFLKGEPLNVCDLEVGPDGAIYFCTGGRGTAGGVYRITYQGTIPESMKQLGSGVAAAVRQPQIESAWARQAVASVKRELGPQWGQLIAGVAYSDENPPHYRTRALDLMQLLGPVPSDDVLMDMAETDVVSVVAKSARLMGLHPSVRTHQKLSQLLTHPSARVQRVALESMLRSDQYPNATDDVVALCGSQDRTLAFLAAKTLAQMPVGDFKSDVLSTNDAHQKIIGMFALLSADPSPETCRTIVRHGGLLLDGYLSDADFVDNLRLVSLAIARGKIAAEDLPRLRAQIAEEFPASEPRMNNELIRLAAYLGADSVADRALQYINGDESMADRAMVAMCLQRLSKNWTPKQRFELLKFYENAANTDSAGSLSMYIMRTTKDFAETLSDDDVDAIVAQGAVWRNAALAALYRVPTPINADTAKQLRNLDRRLLTDPKPGDVGRRLRAGVLALLASSPDDASMNYLRRLWRTEPQRRGPIAMALSVRPDGENWDYLVRSLNILDENTEDLVIEALLGVPVATDDPMALRQLILLGVRKQENGGTFENVERLLEHWTGLERPADASTSMRPWQKWFATTFPDRLPAEPPAADQSRWDFEQLVKYLESDEGRLGDPDAGREVYAKASCLACHEMKGSGTPVGPSLTNISRRYTKREIVESILYPGHVVGDQYASKKVLTLDGRLYVGKVSDRGESYEIRDASNTVREVAKSDVDQILPSQSSIMPSGLLDDLTMKQISDLMAYMGVNETIRMAKQTDERR